MRAGIEPGFIGNVLAIKQEDNDMHREPTESQQRLREALDAVTAEGGVGAAWDVIDTWSKTVHQQVQLHLARNPTQRDQLRALQRGALHAVPGRRGRHRGGQGRSG